MGLDMYLYAKRVFAADSPEATAILAAADYTVPELQRLASLDPREEETSVYLPRWRHVNDDQERMRAEAVTELAGLTPLTTPDSSGGTLSWEDGVAVDVCCIYWRKANAVHGWFVNNCQGGTDDCGDYPVEAEQLAYLRKLCSDALTAYTNGDAGSAQTIMRPVGGFFFGSTDIDEWWAADMQRTIDEIDRVVQAAARIGNVSFSYHSSW